MYKRIQALVSKSASEDSKYLKLKINEAIQNFLLQGLNHFYQREGIVFVGSTSLRFAHKMDRYIKENTINFKVKNFESITFDEDMNVLKDRLQTLLEIEIDLTVIGLDKKRRLDNGFFIPYRKAVFNVNGVAFTIAMYNLTIGDTEKCTPYDENNLGGLKQAEFEDIPSSFAFVACESIGDDKFEASYIYDQTWCIKNGYKIDPEFFEQLINDAHLSMLSVRFDNINLTLRSNSTLNEFGLFQDCVIESTSNQTTLALQLKQCRETLLGDINSLSSLFDETFEDKRNRTLGYEVTQGSSAIIDGKNVQGFGKTSMTALLNK